MPQPTLAETQRLVWTLLAAPEGVVAGLAALDPADRAVAAGLVRLGGHLSPTERLDVYAGMYFYRIHDCLKEDFPAVRAVIGETRFHNLTTDYLLHCPPAHFSLSAVGQRLPWYVQSHALRADWPFLGDLAAFEWAMVEAFNAPDARPIDAAVLAAVAGEDWPDLRFAVSPSLQLFRFDWPIQEIWRQVDDDAAPDMPASAVVWVRVWRQDFRVFHRAIDIAEVAALWALIGGAPFAAVCEHVAAVESAGDAAQRVGGLLQTWLADGILVGMLPSASDVSAHA